MREFWRTWGGLIAALLIPVAVFASRALAQQEASQVVARVVEPVRDEVKETKTKAAEIGDRVTRLETQRVGDKAQLDEMQRDIKELLRRVK